MGFTFRFYKGIVPLWGRQVPYTMMKFACFERTVEALYKYIVPKPRAECNKAEQLVVTFVAGYIAGIFCAVVSHPADSVVSLLNKDKGSTATEALQKLGFKGTGILKVDLSFCFAVDDTKLRQRWRDFNFFSVWGKHSADCHSWKKYLLKVKRYYSPCQMA